MRCCISVDNVMLHLDGVLYYRVVDPYKVRQVTLLWLHVAMVACRLRMEWRIMNMQLFSWHRPRCDLNWERSNWTLSSRRE